MGIFGLAVAAYFLLSSLRDFGVGSYLIQQETLNDNKIRTAFGMWVVISWSLGLAIFATRNYVADIYHAKGIADVLSLVSISLFITPIGQPAQALLTREMRFDVLHHIALASTAITVLTNITLALAGLSYMALAWGMIAGTAVNAALLIAVRPDHLRMLPSFRYWREVLSFGGWLTGVSLIGTVKSEGNRFILGAFINPAAVGLFDRAVQIPNQARQSLFSPIWRVLFPAFSKDIREGLSIGPALEKLVSVTTVVIWPAFLTVGILAQPIIVVLFGENWRVAGQILPYFLFAQALLALLPPAYQILVPHGKVKRYFWLSAITTMSGLALAAIGAMHSLELFALLVPIDHAVYVIATYFAVREYVDVPRRIFMRHYRHSCLVAVISSSPALVCYLVYGTDVPFLALVSVAVVSPILWIAIVCVLKNPVAYEVIQLLSRSATIRSYSGILLGWMNRT